MKYISIIPYNPSMIPRSLVITSSNIVWTKWSRGTASSGPKWIATMFNWNTLKVWFSMNGKKWTRNLDDLGGFGGIWGYILFWKHLVLCDSFEPGHVWDKNMSYFLHGLEIFHPWWPGAKLVGKWWHSWGLRAKKKPPFCLKGDSWGNRVTCTQPLWNVVFVQAAWWKNTRLLWSMEMCAYNLVTLCSVWGKSM